MMEKIGEVLAKARLQKNITLQDAENDTKIRVKYLNALEADDFAVIPGRVYVVGFLRTYAKYLGLDDQKLVAIYQAENKLAALQMEEPVPAALQGQGDKPGKKNIRIKKSSRRFMLILFVLLLLLFSAVVYFFNSWNRLPAGQNEPAAPAAAVETIPPAEVPAETIAPAEDIPPAVVPDQTAEVVVTVKINTASCWLSVTSDGQESYRGLLKAGSSQTFRGQESVKIKFGNAGAAAVTFQGETTDPVGEEGQVVTKEFRINE